MKSQRSLAFKISKKKKNNKRDHYHLHQHKCTTNFIHRSLDTLKTLEKSQFEKNISLKYDYSSKVQRECVKASHISDVRIAGAGWWKPIDSASRNYGNHIDKNDKSRTLNCYNIEEREN